MNEGQVVMIQVDSEQMEETGMGAHSSGVFQGRESDRRDESCGAKVESDDFSRLTPAQCRSIVRRRTMQQGPECSRMLDIK